VTAYSGARAVIRKRDYWKAAAGPRLEGLSPGRDPHDHVARSLSTEAAAISPQPSRALAVARRPMTRGSSTANMHAKAFHRRQTARISRSAHSRSSNIYWAAQVAADSSRMASRVLH